MMPITIVRRSKLFTTTDKGSSKQSQTEAFLIMVM